MHSTTRHHIALAGDHVAGEFEVAGEPFDVETHVGLQLVGEDVAELAEHAEVVEEFLGVGLDAVGVSEVGVFEAFECFGVGGADERSPMGERGSVLVDACGE